MLPTPHETILAGLPTETAAMIKEKETQDLWCGKNFGNPCHQRNYKLHGIPRMTPSKVRKQTTMMILRGGGHIPTKNWTHRRRHSSYQPERAGERSGEEI